MSPFCVLKGIWHRTQPFRNPSIRAVGKVTPATLTQGPGGALPLWESVGMRRGFAPHFRHLDDLFAPPNLTMSTILCWVPFRSPTFSACRCSFCPPNWPNLSFYSDLVGSRFELRAAHPYWFWPGAPPPPPPPTHTHTGLRALLHRALFWCSVAWRCFAAPLIGSSCFNRHLYTGRRQFGIVRQIGSLSQFMAPLRVLELIRSACWWNSALSKSALKTSGNRTAAAHKQRPV